MLKQSTVLKPLMREFERNRINLTLTKTEEMQRVRVQIDELSLLYIQNLNEDGSFLLFTGAVLAGLPSEFQGDHEKSSYGICT